MSLSGDRGHGLATVAKTMASKQLGGYFLLVSGSAAVLKKAMQSPGITTFNISWGGVFAVLRITFPEQIFPYCDYIA